MEKRYLLFFSLTFLAIFGYAQLTMVLAPPPPEQQLAAEDDEQATSMPDEVLDDVAPGDRSVDLPPSESGESESVAADQLESADEANRTNLVAAPVPTEYVTMGSADSQDPFGLLVVFSNKGATIKQIEVNNPKYRDLGTVENKQRCGHAVSGYLGPLIVSDLENRSGIRLEVVGPGTPATKARSESPNAGSGLRVGDIVLAMNGQVIVDQQEFLDQIGATRPGQTISMTIERQEEDGAPQEYAYEIDLERPRLKIIQTEPSTLGQATGDVATSNELAAAASFYLELEQIGSASIKTGNPKIAALPSLRESAWQITRRPKSTDAEQVVEFTLDLGPDQLATIGELGSLRVVRRYRLAPIVEVGTVADNSLSGGYHLKMELEFHNLSDSPRELAYQLDGPAGLPTEGWWYLYKVHPRMWYRAGARDVVWRSERGHELVGCTEISKNAKKNANNPYIQLNASSPADFRYAGVDTQYFAAVLMPDLEADLPSRPLQLSAAVAMPVGQVSDGKRLNLTNVSFRLISRATTILPQEKLTQSFTIFAGPKDPQVLAGYGLEDIIVYGWFKPVAKFMAAILHGAYWITTFGGVISGSYAVAIVLLTVLVRGCMFPLGRRQAQMAAKMQELAPEMKKIAEKYKNDMEKKAKAQKELFKKHNYNPLSGCLPMVIQLPIFIGLYRSLSVDMQLRGAPMLPGLPWCGNLAAPDRLFYWGDVLPTALAAPDGFLGPFFNILPIVTIAFFIVHQKLFTPPPTDEQTRMQHQMMKFMMIFMGFIFFKVAAGLCIYIISSSAWGVAERLLLPKPSPKLVDDTAQDRGKSNPPKSGGSNGSPKPAAPKKKKKKAKGRR